MRRCYSIVRAKFLRRTVVAVLVLLTFIFALQFNIYAEQTGKPLVTIEAEALDENGVFDLVVSVQNFHFVGYQIAVKYNTDAVMPIADEAVMAVGFDEFSEESEIEGVGSVGHKLNTELGYFTYTQYCSPGASGEYVKDRMIYIMDKTEMYRFRFKKLSDEAYGFEIADAFDGDIYDKAFPDGFLVTSFAEERPVCDVVIRYDDVVKDSQSSYYTYAEMYPVNYTKEQRLSGTVYVVIGDYAAAVDGVLFAIDSANKSVVPYEKDGNSYLPLRFICESLEYVVGWDETTGQVKIIHKDGVESVLDTVNSDGTEIVHDRTMVVPELVEKLTNARVYDAGTGEFVVYTGIPEWNPEREAEKQALEAMRFVLLPFFRMFI